MNEPSGADAPPVGTFTRQGAGTEDSQGATNDRPRLSREVLEALVAIAEAFAQRADRRLESAGLTWHQFQILRILQDAEAEGLLVHEVGARMVARTPNITRLVDKLESKGLVTRSREEGDRRTVRLGLTSLAREQFETLETPVAAEVSRTLGTLCEEELARLHALLGRLACAQRREGVTCGEAPDVDAS